MTAAATAVMIITVSIPIELAEEFHCWYDGVHIPELLCIPGILSARRFESVGDPKTFIAVYEMESAEVPDSDAFRRWRDASESTRQMMARFTTVERRVYQRILPLAMG